jgi:hypothetical protein
LSIILLVVLVLLQGFEPVLGTPPRRVRRVNRDDPQTGFVRHRDEAVAELSGRQPGEGTTERLTPPASPHRFPPGGPGVGKVQVLNREGAAPAILRGVNEGCDRLPDAGVTR